MSTKFRVHKQSFDYWAVELPHIGFARRTVLFESHATALAWTLEQVALYAKPHSLYSTATAESWGPWTVKRPRV